MLIMRTPLSPSPSQRFASGPSLSPRRGKPTTASMTPLLGEREGPAAKPWEGEGDALAYPLAEALQPGAAE